MSCMKYSSLKSNIEWKLLDTKMFLMEQELVNVCDTTTVILHNIVDCSILYLLHLPADIYA